MTKNDDIKVGDKVIAKLIVFRHPCEVVAVKNGWFFISYLLLYKWSDIGPTYYKKYRWQLFKINN